jgi:hypothetical protein
MSNYGSSEQKSFTTSGPTEIKANVAPGETAKIQTAVYTADLGDRTEGNQNWAETGGALEERSSGTWTEKAREVGQEASDKARELGYGTEQKLASGTETMKGKASQAGEYMKETLEQGKQKAEELYEAGKEKLSQAQEKVGQTYEQGKMKAGETWEQGKMKAGETYEVGKEKLSAQKEPVMTTQPQHGVFDRVKETVGTATHNIAESLEHAREKAREVFTGSTVTGTTTKMDAPATEVKIKTEPARGTVNRVEVDSNTETKIQ